MAAVTEAEARLVAVTPLAARETAPEVSLRPPLKLYTVPLLNWDQAPSL